MNFWRITSPQRKGDYAFTYINGSLSHSHSMPGLKCHVCGETWSGMRILMHDAPDVVRKRNAKGVWPLPVEQFDALREEAERQIGPASPRLLPGDKFQPAVLDIPSIPRADFLWGSLGSLVVSARIQRSLLRTCSSSVGSAEVMLGKIGKKEARLPAPIPSTGEPEDLIEEAELLADRSAIGPYFEIVPTSDSALPPGAESISICSECSRHEIDDERRRLVMSDDMWRGQPIFYLATTLWILVTDDLKRDLERMRPTNVTFKAV